MSSLLNDSAEPRSARRARAFGSLKNRNFRELRIPAKRVCEFEPEVRDAILGNAGTIFWFRLGVTDAEILAKGFYPEFSVEDLIGLPNYHVYLKLLINGAVSKAFSAETVEFISVRSVLTSSACSGRLGGKTAVEIKPVMNGNAKVSHLQDSVSRCAQN